MFYLFLFIKQFADTPAKTAPKVVSPPPPPVKSSSTTFSDPFGLPANKSNNTFNAFGDGNDPFGAPRPNDPFASASSAAAFNQKLDETDPFRPVDFNAAHDLIKKTMANRSKTPGANMFGGSDFTQTTSTTINRPQSAMPWEPTRQAPPQPGTQAHNDLFDLFG